MRNPRINPRPGDRLAKVLTNRAGVTGVFSRRVLVLEKSYPRMTIVVWTRKRPDWPCRCTITKWRAWAKNAIVAAGMRSSKSKSRQTRGQHCNSVGSVVTVEIIMDDQINPNRRVGECPKRIFWLLPRPPVKPAYKGEDPKAFFRRISQRPQMANPNPGGAARAQ